MSILDMEIIVEIGTEEQKKQIKQELEIIQTVSNQISIPTSIAFIIVPDDFDKKVNELQNTSNYKSIRKTQHAHAKTISTSNGIILVFSKLLFTAKHDNFTRLQFYMHEFMHVVNKGRLPILKEEPTSKYPYLSNLYILFDEYSANRKSLEIIDSVFPQTSIRYRLSNITHLKWFIKPLINDSEHYDIIRIEIEKFRTHGKIEQFLENTKPHFDEVSKAIIYSYSFIDHSSKFQRFQPFLAKSKFINNKTINLINFYRSQFDKGESDLSEGINLMTEFIENFGIRLEDCHQGLYCHVIDI
ncbi:MAG: hypothetical protein WC354_05270 [Candidatus Omnitrophota bacterium]|jgi:hypothetical protein